MEAEARGAMVARVRRAVEVVNFILWWSCGVDLKIEEERGCVDA